jgi:sigma-B regulation protein RsbU (phosphoserine phosphatase)
LSDSQDALELTGVFDQVLLRALTEAGQLMVLPRPLHDIFDEMLGIVERVVPARRILLLLNEEDQELPVIRAARPRGTAREKLVLSHTIIGHVLHERQTCLLNDVNLDPRFSSQDSVIRQNLRSAMVAPLFDNEQVIGLLYADNDDPRFRYNRDQLRAFSLLANLVAVKISNTRLLKSQREKERMDQEVAAAAQVQRSLLASHLPFLPDYQLLARQIPCFEVAGDLYDVTQRPDGCAMIVVGDVTGKGMGAAMLMSSIIAALRVLYQECADLATLAERLHRQILRSSDEIHFATMFLGLLDPHQHQLEYVNAGHNPPLLLCADRDCRTLPSTGLPMGLMPGATYSTTRIDLPVGAMLCVFTDGIPEAMVGEEFYGEKRLQACIERLATRPLEEIIEAVVRDLRAFLGEHVLQDDVTMLLLRRQD